MKGVLRVLHVVGAMNRAGVESWLMQVARRVDPTRTRLVFVVHSSTPSDYDAEILALGHEIAVCPLDAGAARYVLAFARLLRETPDVAAVHSHVNHFSAVPIAVAALCRVPVRVAHGHSDLRSVQSAAGPARRWYYRMTSAVLRRALTVGLASSPDACRSLFGRAPVAGGRFQVMPTGIDIQAFDVPRRPELLTQDCVGPDEVLVLHVARFVAVKNHEFVLEIAEALRRRGSGIRIAMVGGGPLEDRIADEVQRRGLDAVVALLGVRGDMAELLSRADVLILPSLYEGVPVSVLEAQAAGLPCVVSEAVSRAVDEVPGLVHHLPVDDAGRWVDAIEAAAATPRDIGRAQETMRGGDYDVRTSVRRLLGIWGGAR